MADRIDARSLDQLFLEAHTHRYWQPKPVEDATLEAAYAWPAWRRPAPIAARCASCS